MTQQPLDDLPVTVARSGRCWLFHQWGMWTIYKSAIAAIGKYDFTSSFTLMVRPGSAGSGR